MEEEGSRSRRRIDRILTDDYLEDLDELEVSELRRMRDECQREETGVSYTRRVLQGQLDILRSEMQRRSDAGSDEAAEVLADLPAVLADSDRDPSPLNARPQRQLQPPVDSRGRREVDSVADAASLGRIRERDTEDLAQLASELADRERVLSEIRAALLDRIDAIQDELVRRYRDGAADVRDVLAGET